MPLFILHFNSYMAEQGGNNAQYKNNHNPINTLCEKSNNN